MIYSIYLLLILSNLFHLEFFGIFPRETKFLGDLLLILTIILINSYKRKNNIDFIISKKIVPIQYILNLFLLLIVFLLIKTFFEWGEIIFVLRQARRWFLFFLYLYIYLAIIKYQIYCYRIINIYFHFIVVILVIVSSLIYLGYPIGYNESFYQFQGGQLVLKIFVPGAVLIYFYVIYNYYKIKINNKMFNVFKYFLMILVFFLISQIVPFRAWFLTISVITSLVYLFFQKEKSTNKLFLLVVLSALFFYAYDLIIETRVFTWLSSVNFDISDSSSTFSYRYFNDITKLLHLKSLNLFWGLGFIHQDSFASKVIGFSSETNDTGLVELILTSGIIGTVLFFILISVLVIRIYSYTILTNNRNVLISVIISSLILLVSSNLFLYEFGLIPIFIILIKVAHDDYFAR